MGRSTFAGNRLHLIALEPRMMFDGAASATAGATLAHVDPAMTDAADKFQNADFAQKAGPHSLISRDAAAVRIDNLPSRVPIDIQTGPVLGTSESRDWAAFKRGGDFMAERAYDVPNAVIFIDSSINGAQALATEWADRGRVILIDANSDGIDQMRIALLGLQNIDAIHIVSHGIEGAFFIGTTRIDQPAIDGPLNASFAAIGRSLSADGDLLIYGCDVARGATGDSFIQDLARVTNADVAASTNDTGAMARGGDWTLESRTGAIDTLSLISDRYDGLLAPALISINQATTNLRVFDANGAEVANSQANTGFSNVANAGAQRSVGIGAGGFAIWTNAGTVGGQAIDLRARVLSSTSNGNSPDLLSFDKPTAATNDPAFLLVTSNGSGTASLQVQWEIVLAGTNTPIASDVNFTIADIDGTGTNPNAPTRESVVVSTDTLSSYQSAGITDVKFDPATPGVITAFGTQNELANPPQPISAAKFNWVNTSSFIITYNLNRAGSTLAGFSHDGNNEFNFGTGGVTTSIPRLDLDQNDSTASGSAAKRTYIENAPPVTVADSDVLVTNPIGAVQNATITLTNAQAGDVLALGALPAGITGTINTSVAGKITVTLTGASTAANYQAAIAGITFVNTTERPNTADRIVTASFFNGTFNSNLATSTISVVEVNDPPVAINDTASTTEDTPATISVLANDTDKDGDPLSITAATALNGTVVRNANGTITYTPNANFNGTDTITYTISDGRGGTSTATVTVTVGAVNDPPLPVGALPSRTNVDAASGINVATASGFNDVDNATLTYSAAGLPAGLSINAATGVITGTIDRSASQLNGGVYSVVVTASDAGGLTATQTFSWTVTNPAPVATDNTASTNEDAPIASINVLGNDADPDGDPLTVVSASAVNGTVAINADGTLRYTPNANFNGTDTITYTISDGQGGTATAKVVVTVGAVNDPPVPVGTLPARTNFDGTSGISVATAGGFSDVDNAALAYSVTGLPAGLSINAATGVISGTIDRSASQVGGGVYSIVVTARDAGGLTASQTFTWTVINPAPVAGNDTASTNEDTPVTIAVLANDSDPDADPLTVIAATAANGGVVINANGTLTYTPRANFNGTDTITYTISDGQGGTSAATVTITVVAVNDAPIATAIAPRANLDGATVSVPVAGNFSDVDGDTLTYSATGLPAGLSINAATGVISGTIDRSASQIAGGVYSVSVTANDGRGGTASTNFVWTVTNPAPTAANDSATTAEDTPIAAINVLANDSDPDGDPLTVTTATAANGTVTINPDGTLRYVPNANFNGTDTIRYTISDGQGGTASAIVTVTVTGVNDVPTATPLGNQTNLDGQVISLGVGAAFSDADGDPLTFGATGLPAGLSINPATGVISGTIDRSASQANGGNYTITVTASDGKGGTVSQAFTWKVTNPAPVAANDSATTNEDTAIRIDVLANDTDADRDPLTVTTARAGNGTVTINPDGSLQYVPNPNFNGTDTIIYSISDGEGGSSTATVSVAIRAVNDTPTTIGLPNQQDNDGGRVSVPVASAFSDVDGDTLTFSATGLPPGLSIDPATGLITGTLNTNASVNGPYRVTVTAIDPNGAAVSATFVWSIQNQPPLANDDVSTTAEDTAVTVVVLTNDSDPNGDPISITQAVATHGTVVINANNTLTFTPDPDFNGVAQVTYTITDGKGGFSTATLNVTVTAVNDAPDSVALPNAVNQDNQAVSVGVGRFFSDRDGDRLSFTASGLPAGLSIDPATGLITGTIDKSASQPNGGVYSVTVTARDPGGLASNRTFTWTITNPAPTAVNDTATTAEDTPIAAINVLGNDTDPDGDPLTVTAATASNGTVTINADGTLRYVPRANFNGTDTIIYTISDGNGGTSTASVTVTVTPVNDPPVATNDTAATPEDTPVTIPVLRNDTDIDGDPLAVTVATAANGTVVRNADGTITYTPNANFNGTDTITYTISDGKGGTSTATVTVTVTAVNDPPVARNDVATTPEDTPVVVPVLTNDTDVDGDPLTVISATAANGTVVRNPDGTVTYTPNPNFNGTDTITYTISDGKGGTSTATVTVTVTPVNDAPVTTGIAPQANPDATVIALPVASRFSDVDGDPLTFTATGLPAGLTISPAGVISGTIDRSASQPNGGVYTVTVTASDGKGGTVSTTFSWTVTNPSPVAVNDTATTNEDTPVSIAVLANDADPDGDPLTVISATAANGSVVINANGTVTYTPNANFNGTDTITYTISDGNGGTSSAIVTVTVNAVNDAPVATPIASRNNVDGNAVSVPVAGNFSDVDGDPLTFTATGLPAGLTISSAGVISGTIDRSASQSNGGVYSVTVTASDGKGGTVSTTFSWTVTNPPPVAANDAATTPEDTAVTIAVLANDADPDGDPLTVTGATAPNGTVVINANGTITYTPNANFNGTDTITYAISDGQGGTSTATVTVTVTPVNDVPTLDVPIANQANRDGAAISVPVSGNFSDLDGDALAFSATGLPAGLSINPVTGVISGTIDRSASQVGGGNYTVSVTASDGKGGTVTTRFVWTVTNPGPTAVNDSASTAEDTPVTIAVLANDTDPDGDPLTVTSVTAAHGTVVINANGTITYTPAANYNGPDTIVYTISDGQGGTSTANVAINVTAVNDAPTTVGLPDLFDLDSSAVSVPVAAAFSDVDTSDVLSFAATGLPAGLVIDPATGVISGTLAANASVTNGGIYTVTVTATDTSGAPVSTIFTWTISNTAPNAVDDTARTSEDTPVTIAVLTNDTDPQSDPLTVVSATSPNGTVVINGDGTITFTPNPDFNGTATINYLITDSKNTFSTATVTVTVTPVNDAPVAPVPFPDQTGVDGQVAVNLPLGSLFSDIDAGDSLTFSATGLPAGLTINPVTGAITGTIDRSASQVGGGVYQVVVTATDSGGLSADRSFLYTVSNPPPVAANDSATTNEDTPVTISVLANDSDPDGDPLTVTLANAGNGIVVINANGTITYTPDANFNGTDTITYTISDGQGGTSTATVTVTVAPINDTPIAKPIAPRTNADADVVSVPVAANFSDPDGDPLSFTATGLPVGLTINAATGVISGTIDRNASQPNGGIYPVIVTASDGKGGSVSTTFNWTVTNPPPVAAADTATTNEDTPVTVSVLTNDSDPDDDPLTVTTASAANGTVVINANGTITYTPNANFNGTDTITYTISDGNGGTSTATVTLTVTPVNDPPVARPDTAVTNEDTPVRIPVLGDDTDVDGNPLTVTAASAPNGTVTINPDGTISYAPNANFNGTDTITYTISDGQGGTSTTTVTVTVNPVNDPPVAINDNAVTPEDVPVTISVLSNDTDIDGDRLTVTGATATNGTVVVNPDGTVTFTPNPNFNGTAVVTYTISDGKGGISTATATITVVPVNDPPVAANDTATTNEDTPVRIAVLANDTDVDGNPLIVTAATAGNGTVVINADGSISYTPKPNFNGTDTITYTISDGQGGFSTATVTVTVVPVNDPPVAASDVTTTLEDTPVTVNVLGNDSDPDGDPLTVVAATAPNGTVTINPDGTIRYTPNANFNGTDTITYTVSDGKGGTATATVTVTVAPVNDPPVARPDTATVNEDTPLTFDPRVNDSDPEGDPLTVTNAVATNGRVIINPDGTITYTPNANFNGTDTITYTISDGKGGFTTSTVTVTVVPVNDPPIALPDYATIVQNTTIDALNVLANDRDVDGDPLTVSVATAANGRVTINPDGTLRYVPNPLFVGNDTITYTISDGKGGTATATVTITVLQGLDQPNTLQLLEIGTPHYVDLDRIDTRYKVDWPPIDVPLIITDMVNGFRSLNGTPNIDVRAPVLAAVNNIQSLNGIGDLDVNAGPITQVVAQLDAIRDLRFGVDRLFDPRFGDFVVKGLTGFSVRQVSGDNAQVMVESVVRDGRIYLEARDIGKDGDPRIVEFQFRMRDGKPLPDWIHFDARGLAIIERPADADEIRMIVRAIRADGKVIETPVKIQGATGEIQLDQKRDAGTKTSSAAPLHQTMAMADASAAAEAARLAAAFQSAA
jgi:large repetitive protein